MTAKALNALYHKFNRAYFGQRLPAFRVKIAYGDTSSKCWPDLRLIWISCYTPEAELESALLHEMVHIVTGGDHDDAFRAELRRIAALGCIAAAHELEEEEWCLRTEAAARTIDPHLSFAEARQAILAIAGAHPYQDTWPARGLIVWRKRTIEQNAPVSVAPDGA